LFQKRLKEFPDDYACELYIERCEKFMKNEPAANWNGITKLDKK